MAREWGPIVAIIVIVTVLIAIMVFTTGPSNKDESNDTPTINRMTVNLDGFNCEEVAQYSWRCTR